jgi:hypothetical protein
MNVIDLGTLRAGRWRRRPDGRVELRVKASEGNATIIMTREQQRQFKQAIRKAVADADNHDQD